MASASIYFTLDQIDGKHDVKRIKKTLDELSGVTSVSVNTETDSVAVDYDTTGVLIDRIQKQLERAGYTVTQVNLESHFE